MGEPVSVVADGPPGRPSLIANDTFAPPSSLKGGTEQGGSKVSVQESESRESGLKGHFLETEALVT